MTPVKIKVLALYYSSAEVADVAEVAVSSILCLPMPMPMPLLGFLCLSMPLLGRDDGRRRRFL